MSRIPNTFTFASGKALSSLISPSGIGGIGVLPGQGGVINVYTPNPFDLTDIPVSNALMTPGCACEEKPNRLTNLSVTTDSSNSFVFLFRSKRMTLASPVVDETGDCYYIPIPGLKNVVKFHRMEEGTLDFHLQSTTVDPEATNQRLEVHNLSNSIENANKLKIKGWEQIYGDQPGASFGRDISFEIGKAARGLFDVKTIESIPLTFEAKDTSLIIRSISGLFIRELIFFYDDTTLTKDETFHLIFKYDAANSVNCVSNDYRNRDKISQETVIDNIVISPSKGCSKKLDEIAGPPRSVTQQNKNEPLELHVDTRYTTGDYIELIGYVPKNIKKIYACFLTPKQYYENVLTSSNFASSFDNRGRLFVFYEEEIPFTELPYSDNKCTAPLTSSSSSSFPGIPATPQDRGTTSGGIGGETGGGTGGGGGGGIPGNSPSKTKTSSTDALPTSASTSTSSGSATANQASSSSSSSLPGTVQSASISSVINTNSATNCVFITWQPPADKDVVSYNIYYSLQLNAGFKKLVNTIDNSYTDCAASVNQWNYYRITAVNSRGVESTYVPLQIFLVNPQFCENRACLKCKDVLPGFRSPSSFNIFFSKFAPTSLAFPCDSCDGKENGFIRILDDAFYENDLSKLQIGGEVINKFAPSLEGVKVPKKFCLLSNCDSDPSKDNVDKNCTWSNTYYMPAVVSGCKDYGCTSYMDRILLPMNIVLKQTNDGWELTATITYGQRCGKRNSFILFHSIVTPKVWTIQDVINEGTYYESLTNLVKKLFGITDQATLDASNQAKVNLLNLRAKCLPPERFINFMEPSYGNQGSVNLCALYLDAAVGIEIIGIAENTNTPIYRRSPGSAFKQFTGTISAAMSPDLGRTWFKFQGITPITNDRKAINPFIAHDKVADIFHIFWIERDSFNEDNILLAKGLTAGITGFDAQLKHMAIPAFLFSEEDAFVPFFPLPSSSGTNTFDAQNYSGTFYDQQLSKLSLKGRAIRENTIHTIVKEEHFGNDSLLFGSSSSSSSSSSVNSLYSTSLTDGPIGVWDNVNKRYIYPSSSSSATAKRITLIYEQNSAYVDTQGRLNVIRFGQTGTLVDPPSRLTRRRRRKVPCGNFTWSVSGVTDLDCACKWTMGSHKLEYNVRKATFEDPNWTLGVSADYRYWEMKSDNGLFTFRKARTLSLCPPTGVYELTCQRCMGNVIGTLDVSKVAIYGNGTIIDSSDVPASESNDTYFYQVLNQPLVEHEFTIKNMLDTELILTGDVIGTGLVYVTGADYNGFQVTQYPKSKVPIGGSTTFKIQFKPKQCLVMENDYATVKIPMRFLQETMEYSFNIKGQCYSDVTVVPQFTPGASFSADAIGTILTSLDAGSTWSEETKSIKAGQNANIYFDSKSNALNVIYVVDAMLFSRRYPAVIYRKQEDRLTDLDEAFDGFNIVKPPELILPNLDLFQYGTSYTLAQLAAMPYSFDLANIRIPANVLDIFESDLTSKKTALVNEKDPRGMPIFLSGNKTGTLINAIYPYSSTYLFNEQLAVAQTKPAVYVTKSGAVRFFYVDINGNVTGGTISGIAPNLDLKLKV